MSSMSTQDALSRFFIRGFGWLLLLGHVIFAIRTATLWLSRGKDPAPLAEDILAIAWYWPFGIGTLALVVALVGLGSTIHENWKYRSLINSDFGRYLDRALPLTFAVPLLLGLLVAWAFGLNVFGGTFATILTLVQIAAGALPLIAKALE